MNKLISMHSLTTLDDWLVFIENNHPKHIDMNLERINEVIKKMDVVFTCPVVTVGGTNGKGSTCAILESCLKYAGYRVGLYIKPHFLRFNERARIEGTPVSDNVLIAAFKTVEICRGDILLTYFEFTTLAVIKLMANLKLDIVILEVGLGGRFDAVNVINANIGVITSIDIDHVEYLGHTREDIGFEKAGIYRANRVAICSDPHPPKSLIQHAEFVGADLWLIGRDFNYVVDRFNSEYWSYHGRAQCRHALIHPSLRGANQLFNATAALAVLEALQVDLPISTNQVRSGLIGVKLPGRFQVLSGQPLVILDIAHNLQAASTLSVNLNNMGFYPNTYAVFGCMRDKDINGILNQLYNQIDYWCVTDLQESRAASATQLKDMLHHINLTQNKKTYKTSICAIMTFQTPTMAFEHAIAMANKTDRIIVFGSFLTVADIMKACRLTL